MGPWLLKLRGQQRSTRSFAHSRDCHSLRYAVNADFNHLLFMILGPIIGAPFPLSSYPEDSAPPPRAVSEEYFKSVCPPWRRRNIHIKELHNGLEYAEGGTILEHYIRVIEAVEEKCLVLWGKHDHPFDWR